MKAFDLPGMMPTSHGAMDIPSIENKLRDGKYYSTMEFLNDVRIMIDRMRQFPDPHI